MRPIYARRECASRPAGIGYGKASRACRKAPRRRSRRGLNWSATNLRLKTWMTIPTISRIAKRPNRPDSNFVRIGKLVP